MHFLVVFFELGINNLRLLVVLQQSRFDILKLFLALQWTLALGSRLELEARGRLDCCSGAVDLWLGASNLSLLLVLLTLPPLQSLHLQHINMLLIVSRSLSESASSSSRIASPSPIPLPLLPWDPSAIDHTRRCHFLAIYADVYWEIATDNRTISGKGPLNILSCLKIGATCKFILVACPGIC